MRRFMISALQSIGLFEHIRGAIHQLDPAIRDFHTVEKSLSHWTNQDTLAAKTERTIAVLPPAHEGSLGDEALLRGLFAYFEGSQSQIRQIALGKCGWGLFDSPSIAILPNTPNEWSEFITSMSAVTDLYIIGADIMDGGYGLQQTAKRIKLAYFCDKIGIKTTITGMSFNKQCPVALTKLYRKLSPRVSICLRDPNSKTRFEQATGLQARQTADMAFLMKADSHEIKNMELFKWIKQRKEIGRKLLLLNVNRQSVRSADQNQHTQKITRHIRLHEEALNRFLQENPNYDALLVPHDYRQLLNDRNLSSILKNHLRDGPFSDRVKCVSDRLSAAATKGLAEYANIAFSGRMHFAIACSSMKIPVGGFDYQDKFSGFMKVLHLPPHLLIDANTANGESLFTVFQDLAQNEIKYRDTIANQLPRIHQLASANFFNDLKCPPN